MKILMWLTPIMLGATSVNPTANAVAPSRIVVIVNRNNPLSNLTIAELATFYLGRATQFGNGTRIALCEHEPVRGRFYKTVLRMSEAAVSRHWIGLVFSERNAKPPKEFAIADSAQRFVANARGGICFIESPAMIDSGVKAVTVGGYSASDPSYPLR